MRSLVRVTFVPLAWLASAAAQDTKPTPAPASRESADAEVQAAHASWEKAWRAFADAAQKARSGGRQAKGAALPAEVQKLQQAADSECRAALERFGDRADLAPRSLVLVARMHEANRDYAAAVRAYERALSRAGAGGADPDTLHALCIAAMNSKDDKLAAKWMRTLLDQEDQGEPAGRRLDIRMSYYPRTLIALDDWLALGKHVEALGGDAEPACRAAATTFGVVVKMHVGDVAGAEKLVAEIRAEPSRYPEHQAWAVAAQLALLTHRGEFDEAARTVREFLADSASESRRQSAQDTNQRRYLAAVAPFLGKEAPRIALDHWVAGEVEGSDPLATLRGRVVVLDFWQPWCEPCRNAMPHLVALQKAYGDALQVLGLCKVEDWGYDVAEKKAVRPLAKPDYPAHVAKFHADMHLNYPLGIADTDANSRAYQVAGIPTLVVIDRQGVVRYMSCGAGEPGLLELAITGVLRK